MEEATGYDSLTEKQKQIYDEYIAKRKASPECNKTDNVLTIVIGRPTNDLCEVNKKTNIVRLGGCCESSDAKKYECDACHVKFD